jgi:membrane protein
MKWVDIFDLLKETYAQWSDDNASRLAAALSYYTIFSLAPLLVVVVAVTGLALGQNTAQTRIINRIGLLVGNKAADFIQSMVSSVYNQNANILATAIGIITILLGATGVFDQLQSSLNVVWKVAPPKSQGIVAIVKGRFLSFVMVIGIGLLLLLSIGADAALSSLSKFSASLFPEVRLLWRLVSLVISFGMISVLFALIFKVLPDADIAWHDVWLGGAVTALLFTVGKFLIGIYLGEASLSSTYGAAGSLVVILLWVYYSAQIFLFGAEFTQVYANQFRSRIQPVGAGEGTS